MSQPAQSRPNPRTQPRTIEQQRQDQEDRRRKFGAEENRREAADDALAGRRSPPHDADVECRILAAITCSPTARGLAFQQLQGRHFYLPQHQRIWDAIDALGYQHKQIDLVVVKNKLKELGTLEDAGGDAYVDKVLISETSGLHIGEYIEILLNQTIARKTHHLAQEMLADVHVGGGIAPAELAEKYSDLLLDAAQDRLRDRNPHISATMDDIFNEIQQAAQDGYFHVPAFSTGYPWLDEKLDGGFKPGDLVVVAARPGVGKTTFMLNMIRAEMERAQRAGADCDPMLIFNLEVTPKKFTNNLLAALSRVPHRLIRNRTFFADVRNTVDQGSYDRVINTITSMRHNPIWLEWEPGLTLPKLRGLVRQHKQRGAKVVMIDYLQLMTPPDLGGRASREEKVAAITKELKVLALTYDIPIIILAQLNREATKRSSPEPQLSDLRESGAIEQDADIILMGYRLEDHPDTVLYRIAKNREGPTTIGDVHNPRWRFHKATFLLEGGADLEGFARMSLDTEAMA